MRIGRDHAEAEEVEERWRRWELAQFIVDGLRNAMGTAKGGHRDMMLEWR